MKPANPLCRFPVVRTCDVDEMRAAMAQIQLKPVISPEGSIGTYDITFNNYQLRNIGISFVKFGAAVRVDHFDTNFISQMFPISGKGEIVSNGIATPLNLTSGAVSSAGASFTARRSDNYEHLVLRIDPTAAGRLLSAIVEKPIGPLQFELSSNFLRGEGRVLRDQFAFLVHELNSARAPLPSMLLDEFEQTLMHLFLYSNRHNYSHLLEREAAGAAPSQVCRAEEYIEANWNQPISMEILAEITGVSVLSLTRSFKRSRGYTPMQFARLVRQRRKAAH
jgi:AraC-binding-like domain